MCGFKSQLDIAKNRISKLEDESVKIFRKKVQRNKAKESTEDKRHIRNNENIYQMCNHNLRRRKKETMGKKQYWKRQWLIIFQNC